MNTENNEIHSTSAHSNGAFSNSTATDNSLPSRSISELIAQRERELAELRRKQQEEQDEGVKQRRMLVEKFIKDMGASNAREVIVMIRNLYSPPKGKRMTSNTKQQVLLAIKNGATMAEIKQHFGLSSASYYKIKSAMGLTRPNISKRLVPTRSYSRR